MKQILVLCFLLLTISAIPVSAQEKIPGDGSSLTCQLILSEFVNKIGKTHHEIQELYMRCSVQDYFIKLCESDVGYEELKPFINKGITVEYEIRNGAWDICKDDPDYAQSRIGPYIIIKKILH
ncbi:MAG: hypothetical protein IAE67_00060 [Candidatus Competibacteraceae bacterium]|nr:hypothetical protein [Candidatus Competibacteraceae bacterium]